MEKRFIAIAVGCLVKCMYLIYADSVERETVKLGRRIDQELEILAKAAG